MRPPLVPELASRYLLCDGAMGTQLFKHGMAIGGCAELWNVDSPEQVLAVHGAYVDAGADCITTNTFGANRYRLEARGVAAARMTELNRAGAALARQAAGDGRWVLGSLGPCTGKVGQLAPDETAAAFAEQITALAAAEVDALILETQTDLTETRSAIDAWKATAPTLPLFVSLAFARMPQGGGIRLIGSGETMEKAIATVASLCVSGIGANCGVDVDIYEYSTIIAAIRAQTDGPVLAQPNAGRPAACGGQVECADPPELMVEGVWGLIRAGANLIGGCCGTTPEHIQLFREELDRL